MLDDNFLMIFLNQAIRVVPTLLVCIIGIMVVQTRLLPGKTKNFATAGLALLILGALASVAFSAYLSSGVDYASSGFRFMQMIFFALSQILHGVALILLILAICSKQQVGAPENNLQNPYQ